MRDLFYRLIARGARGIGLVRPVLGPRFGPAPWLPEDSWIDLEEKLSPETPEKDRAMGGLPGDGFPSLEEAGAGGAEATERLEPDRATEGQRAVRGPETAQREGSREIPAAKLRATASGTAEDRDAGTVADHQTPGGDTLAGRIAADGEREIADRGARPELGLGESAGGAAPVEVGAGDRASVTEEAASGSDPRAGDMPVQRGRASETEGRLVVDGADKSGPRGEGIARKRGDAEPAESVERVEGEDFPDDDRAGGVDARESARRDRAFVAESEAGKGDGASAEPEREVERPMPAKAIPPRAPNAKDRLGAAETRRVADAAGAVDRADRVRAGADRNSEDHAAKRAPAVAGDGGQNADTADGAEVVADGDGSLAAASELAVGELPVQRIYGTAGHSVGDGGDDSGRRMAAMTKKTGPAEPAGSVESIGGGDFPPDDGSEGSETRGPTGRRPEFEVEAAAGKGVGASDLPKAAVERREAAKGALPHAPGARADRGAATSRDMVEEANAADSAGRARVEEDSAFEGRAADPAPALADPGDTAEDIAAGSGVHAGASEPPAGELPVQRRLPAEPVGGSAENRAEDSRRQVEAIAREPGRAEPVGRTPRAGGEDPPADDRPGRGGTIDPSAPGRRLAAAPEDRKESEGLAGPEIDVARRETPKNRFSQAPSTEPEGGAEKHSDLVEAAGTADWADRASAGGKRGFEVGVVKAVADVAGGDGDAADKAEATKRVAEAAGAPAAGREPPVGELPAQRGPVFETENRAAEGRAEDSGRREEEARETGSTETFEGGESVARADPSAGTVAGPTETTDSSRREPGFSVEAKAARRTESSRGRGMAAERQQAPKITTRENPIAKTQISTAKVPDLAGATGADDSANRASAGEEDAFEGRAGEPAPAVAGSGDEAEDVPDEPRVLSAASKPPAGELPLQRRRAPETESPTANKRTEDSRRRVESIAGETGPAEAAGSVESIEDGEFWADNDPGRSETSGPNARERNFVLKAEAEQGTEASAGRDVLFEGRVAPAGLPLEAASATGGRGRAEAADLIAAPRLDASATRFSGDGENDFDGRAEGIEAIAGASEPSAGESPTQRRLAFEPESRRPDDRGGESARRGEAAAAKMDSGAAAIEDERVARTGIPADVVTGRAGATDAKGPVRGKSVEPEAGQEFGVLEGTEIDIERRPTPKAAPSRDSGADAEHGETRAPEAIAASGVVGPESPGDGGGAGEFGVGPAGEQVVQRRRDSAPENSPGRILRAPTADVEGGQPVNRELNQVVPTGREGSAAEESPAAETKPDGAAAPDREIAGRDFEAEFPAGEAINPYIASKGRGPRIEQVGRLDLDETDETMGADARAAESGAMASAADRAVHPRRGSDGEEQGGDRPSARGLENDIRSVSARGGAEGEGSDEPRHVVKPSLGRLRAAGKGSGERSFEGCEGVSEPHPDSASRTGIERPAKAAHSEWERGAIPPAEATGGKVPPAPGKAPQLLGRSGLPEGEASVQGPRETPRSESRGERPERPGETVAPDGRAVIQRRDAVAHQIEAAPGQSQDTSGEVSAETADSSAGDDARRFGRDIEPELAFGEPVVSDKKRQGPGRALFPGIEQPAMEAEVEGFGQQLSRGGPQPAMRASSDMPASGGERAAGIDSGDDETALEMGESAGPGGAMGSVVKIPIRRDNLADLERTLATASTRAASAEAPSIPQAVTTRIRVPRRPETVQAADQSVPRKEPRSARPPAEANRGTEATDDLAAGPEPEFNGRQIAARRAQQSTRGDLEGFDSVHQALAEWFASPPSAPDRGMSESRRRPPVTESEPSVSIRIGRIEVRPEAPRAEAPPPPPFRPKLSLSEYLQQRRAGRR